jgi:predicted RNA-binding Zn-ribbon protein involved in translation (DUF1610 family)
MEQRPERDFSQCPKCGGTEVERTEVATIQPMPSTTPKCLFALATFALAAGP